MRPRLHDSSYRHTPVLPGEREGSYTCPKNEKRRKAILSVRPKRTASSGALPPTRNRPLSPGVLAVFSRDPYQGLVELGGIASIVTITFGGACSHSLGLSRALETRRASSVLDCVGLRHNYCAGVDAC